MKKPSREEAMKAVTTLIEWAGDDPKREGLVETPKRVVKAYEEFFAGYEQDPEEILQKTFKEVEGYDFVKEFVDDMVTYWDDNLTKLFRKKRDIQIADAVIELFKRRGDLENFNKKALYIMIREMTDVKTQHVTRDLKYFISFRIHNVRHLDKICFYN